MQISEIVYQSRTWAVQWARSLVLGFRGRLIPIGWRTARRCLRRSPLDRFAIATWSGRQHGRRPARWPTTREHIPSGRTTRRPARRPIYRVCRVSRTRPVSVWGTPLPRPRDRRSQFRPPDVASLSRGIPCSRPDVATSVRFRWPGTKTKSVGTKRPGRPPKHRNLRRTADESTGRVVDTRSPLNKCPNPGNNVNALQSGQNMTDINVPWIVQEVIRYDLLSRIVLRERKKKISVLFSQFMTFKHCSTPMQYWRFSRR